MKWKLYESWICTFVACRMLYWRRWCSCLHFPACFEDIWAESCRTGLFILKAWALLWFCWQLLKHKTLSCLQICVLDLPSPNPTSNMHLSPGQLAQITTALPEKGLLEPQGIRRRGWIIPSIQRPRGSFFFSKCFQFPLGELLLRIFFPFSVSMNVVEALIQEMEGGGKPLKNVSHHFKTQVELIKSKFQQCVQTWARLKIHFIRFNFKTIPLRTCR